MPIKKNPIASLPIKQEVDLLSLTKTLQIKPSESMAKFFIAIDEYKDALKRKFKLKRGLSFEVYGKPIKGGYVFTAAIVPVSENRLLKRPKAEILM